MTGWACPALALPMKLTSPTETLQNVSEVGADHNAKILGSVKSSGDAELDTASWEKSDKEFNVTILLGPFPPDELPAGARLLPRRPI